MYSRDQLRSAFENPRSVVREIDRWHYTKFRRRFNESGVDILSADWDNLLILDACRYDVFEDCYGDYGLTGTLSCVETRGTATMEYLRANFHGRDAYDTVYVAGTTMLYREGVLDDKVDFRFHEIVDAWRNPGSDEGLETPTPEEMEQAALDAAETYPDKRLIVHFIQPHIPFLGEFGRQRFGDVEGSIWRKQRRGEVKYSDDDLWKAYEENLHQVLPAVTRLGDALEGKTVISSDHGQLFGERLFPIPMREYGHPNGIYHDKLTSVPWFETESDSRKEVISEQPATDYKHRQADEYDGHAREALRELGYID